MRRPGAAVAAASAAVGTLLLLGVYLFDSFVLARDVSLGRYSSGIFDMDVRRVVMDVASGLPAAGRASVHPLQKLLLSPLGRAVDRAWFGGQNPLAAAQVLLAIAVTAYCFAAGWLAMQLSRGSRVAGIAAGLVCGASFSSVLAATVPESAAFSSFGALAPLLLLNARLERPFPWWEALLWGVIGALCFGLTVTQLMHWGIALGTRLYVLRRNGAPLGGTLPQAAVATALVGVLVFGGAWLQTQRYPRTKPFYAESVIEKELRWTRPDLVRREPLRHGLRLLGHFAVLDFAAPFPGYSPYLMKRGWTRYWSLSVEEAGLERWSALQRVLGVAVLACVLFALAVGRWRDVRLLAPALCVASQYALHFWYGREYVLYSPHWHGVLVALLVAGAWNGLADRGRRWLPVGAGVLAAALLANSLVVMQQVYREVEAGLEAEKRDLQGELVPEESSGSTPG